jgi:hypothetical protein
MGLIWKWKYPFPSQSIPSDLIQSDHTHTLTLTLPHTHIHTYMHTHTHANTHSPNGLLLAVGFGGRVGKGKESSGGMLRVYSTSDVATLPVLKLAEHNDAKQWVSDVKFSADGGTIAIGTY